MLWIVAAAVLAAAGYLMAQSWRRGRPALLVFGLLFLAVGILLSTLALLRDTPEVTAQPGHGVAAARP